MGPDIGGVQADKTSSLPEQSGRFFFVKTNLLLTRARFPLDMNRQRMHRWLSELGGSAQHDGNTFLEFRQRDQKRPSSCSDGGKTLV